jgi:hypothetical protein
MPLLLDVLRLLMSGYRHAFRPSLEHAAALVAALLPSMGIDSEPSAARRLPAWQDLTIQALRLLRVSNDARQMW